MEKEIKVITKKPYYIIREAIDGNGKIEFHIMARWGWIWPFTFYTSKRTRDTLVDANKVASEWERERKHNAGTCNITNVQDYNIGKVPSHIPTKQEERYLKCLKKKK